MKIRVQDLDDYIDEKPAKQKIKRKKPKKSDTDYYSSDKKPGQ
jgi:hypothetical protein